MSAFLHHGLALPTKRRALLTFALSALLILMLSLPGRVAAAENDRLMAMCRNAAIKAADRNGVPRAVMLAISLVETRTRRGGKSGPWPWTVNVAGKGAWFDSRAAALLHAQRALKRGQKSFDVGCFQLNYKWHGRHFTSIDQMFEPGPSGDYAAKFVRSLFAETGDWIKASGFYHSRTGKHAKRYRNLVARAIAQMGGKVPKATQLAESAPPLREVQRVFRVQRGTLVPAERGHTVRAPETGSIGLVVLRRGKDGLLRLSSRASGG